MPRFTRVLARLLRLLGRGLRIVVLCLGALGPSAPPPPPSPRRQPEAQIVEESDDS